jgi:hypothetical protein
MIALHITFVLMVAVAIFCRARHMDSSTPRRAKVQHGGALVVAVLSLPLFVPPEWGAALLGLALYLFLALDSRQAPGHRGLRHE